MIAKSLRRVSTKVRKLPHYYGLTDVDLFLDEFEREVPKEHHFQALELALCATLAYWWGTHKEKFTSWKEDRWMMQLRFVYANTRMNEKYSGKDDPHENLAWWTRAWGIEPQPKWVHIFYHTLDTIPMKWYLERKLHHGTTEWDILREYLFFTDF